MPPAPKIRISTLFRSTNRVSGVRERRQWIRNAISSRIQVSMAPDQFSDAISDPSQTFVRQNLDFMSGSFSEKMIFSWLLWPKCLMENDPILIL